MATQDEIKFLANPNIGSQKKKYCRFKKFGLKHVDYKDENFLIQFVNEQGKLLPRRLTGKFIKIPKTCSNCSKKSETSRNIAFRNRSS
jgi:small subunit ribosomal protein S18